MILGYKVYAISLVALLILSVASSSAFASYHMESRASININTASTSYNPGDSVVVNISVEPVTENQIAISIFDPEKPFATVSLLPDRTGMATHAFALPEEALAGEWRVSATYMDAEAETTFSVTKVETAITPAPVPGTAAADEKASCWIRVAQISYDIGESAMINVGVSPVTDEPIIVTVNGPDGITYFEERFVPTAEGTVQFWFKLGEDYPAGQWTIFASYLDASARESFNVELVEEEPTPIPIEVFTDKESYTAGETIIITVAVDEPVTGTDPGVGILKAGITIVGPDGETYFVGSPGEEIGVDEYGRVKVQFHWDTDGDIPTGDWIVIASYGDSKARRGFFIIDRSIPAAMDTSKDLQFYADKVRYIPGDTVSLRGEFTPSSKLTILVLDPDERVYLQEDIEVGRDGAFSFAFEIVDDAKLGKWSIQVLSGSDIIGLEFDVEESAFDVPAQITFPNIEGTAVIKNLKKLTLMSVKNSGEAPLSSLLIKVDDGMIRFVKARHWDRERISDNIVMLTPTVRGWDPEKKEEIVGKAQVPSGLEPGNHLIVLLVWKDRPEIEGKMRIELQSVQDYLKELEESIEQLEEELASL
ncbi:MAG: hypothetical protein ACE5KA_08495, partial [Nitrososphaerales archaeon]